MWRKELIHPRPSNWGWSLPGPAPRVLFIAATRGLFRRSRCKVRNARRRTEISRTGRRSATSPNDVLFTKGFQAHPLTRVGFFLVRPARARTYGVEVPCGSTDSESAPNTIDDTARAAATSAVAIQKSAEVMVVDRWLRESGRPRRTEPARRGGAAGGSPLDVQARPGQSSAAQARAAGLVRIPCVATRVRHLRHASP